MDNTKAVCTYCKLVAYGVNHSCPASTDKLVWMVAREWYLGNMNFETFPLELANYTMEILYYLFGVFPCSFFVWVLFLGILCFLSFRPRLYLVVFLITQTWSHRFWRYFLFLFTWGCNAGWIWLSNLLQTRTSTSILHIIPSSLRTKLRLNSRGRSPGRSSSTGLLLQIIVRLSSILANIS